MTEGIKDRVAIVGMGCTKFGERWDASGLDLMVEACYEAYEDAGLGSKDIQAAWLGTVASFNTGQPAAEALKLDYIPITRVENACATATDAFRNACYAVAAGIYDIVLAVGVEKLKDSGFAGLATGVQSGSGVEPPSPPPVQFALAATSYFHTYGLSYDEGKQVLGQIAVKNHHNGALHPKAHLRREITLEQVLKAPMIAWPLGLFDCCGVSDGAACAIVTTPEIARELRSDAVTVKALQIAVTSGEEMLLPGRWDGTYVETSRQASRRAYAEAGITSPREELSLLDRWREALSHPHDEILLTGFYTNLVPYLAQARVLDPLRQHIVGSEGLWGCGGDTHKMGLLDHTEQIASLLGHVFRDLGVRRVWCSMSAEAVMLTEILPKRYGVSFDLEVSTLDEWLWGRLQRGEIEIRRSRPLRLTVHDHCMSRYLGGRSHDVSRDIVRACGGELVEMAHCRDHALCCGWAATIPTLFGPGSDNPRRSLTYMLASLRRRLAEARDAGAEGIVASCPACYLFLSLAAVLGGDDLRVFHPLELVEYAAGGDPEPRARQRAVDVLAVAMHLLAGSGTGRFHPAPIDPTSPITPPPATRADVRSIRRWSRLLRAALLREGPRRAVLPRGIGLTSDLYSTLMQSRKKRAARRSR